MKALTLSELNSMVSTLIDTTFADTYWIQAEISEAHTNRGHCYLELIQKSSSGNNLIAKARAQIWANKWAMIAPYFYRATGQQFGPGLQVLVNVEVTFHPLYGYSLSIIDIDPTYTLGDMARRRKEILEQLRIEGIDTMNKELPLPALLQNIAIISSETAAGLGDFINQLNSNPRHLAFRTCLFPAAMQGSNVEQSIIKALNAIADESDLWDVVVIIRGGGSTSDLSAFDSLMLAENVAQFPLPIITGIGHERDDTVIDLISHTRVKTPTAAAEFLIHHQTEQLDDIEDLANRIIITTQNKLQQEINRVNQITRVLPSLFADFKEKATSNLNSQLSAIQFHITQQVARQQNAVLLTDTRLSQSTANLLTRHRHSLEVIQTRLDSADPKRILQLGFSITRVNGKVVMDTSTIAPGDKLETTLSQGTITSTVTSKQ